MVPSLEHHLDISITAQANGTKEAATNGFQHEVVPASGKIAGTAFRARKLRIVMVGAGISGIQFAHDVTTRMENYELNIYEKNSDLGGTWFENKYPGCACDVPAHTYQFSWEPNHRWTKFFAPAPEICSYLNRVVDKHDLRKYMHFDHRAINAAWSDKTSTWKVQFETFNDHGQLQIVTTECDIFVQGVGTLNAWQFPKIDGLDDFKGQLMHTATWDDSVDMTGKKVAVIGNGASAVQCVAALQPAAGKLYNFMRTASWMLPHLFSGGAVQKDYPSDFMDELEKDPARYYEFRRQLEVTLASGFEALWSGSAAQDEIRKITIQHMEETIHDPKMMAALMPKFVIGCRRFTPGDHYLHALQQDNVSMISDPIVRVTKNSIIDGTGASHEVDAIICATGFDASYEPRFTITGKGGYNLADNWGKDKPTESYMGALVANFPNHFVFNAPICPVIGSAFPGIAATSNFILRVIDRLQHDELKSISVKQSAQTDFNRWAQERMSNMAWSGDCKSWYKNSAGKVFIPWPGTILHYLRTTEFIRWEDFEFDWAYGNKYASLGNGVTSEGFATQHPPWLKQDGRPRSSDLKPTLIL